MKLSLNDQRLRGHLTQMIAEIGRAPSIGELANRFGSTEQNVVSGLKRLHEAHVLLLHPHTVEPWVVHPFALSPGSCWVETPKHGYWASCLYCALGIAAAINSPVQIHTRIGGEAEAVIYQVDKTGITPCETVFHLSIPVNQWWDNVIHSCASFQPFREEADIDIWCERHGFPKGAVLQLPQLWSFAQDWYGNYLSEPWYQRSKLEIETIFTKHGLTGPFWSLDHSS